MMFSIIIPVYKAEQTIRRCLDSVSAQTCGDFEVLMIDDGSPDGSAAICAAYAASDPRFRLLQQQNQGVSAARNLGLRTAQGTYIAFLDSDDAYLPDYLETFRHLVEAHPNLDCFWCGFDELSDNGAVTHHVFEPDGISHLNRRDIMLAHERWMDSTLWNKLFSRRVIAEAGISMDRSLSLGEDMMFVFQYLDAARDGICVVNRPLYLYTHLSNGTLDSKYRPDLKEIYDLLDERILVWLTKWRVSSEHIRKYHNSVFYTQERILRNTFRVESPLSNREKYRINRQILRSEKFRTALNQSDCFIHPLYRFAYRTGSYRIVQLMDYLSARKNRG